MKKTILSVGALSAAIALAGGLASCGGSNAKNEDSLREDSLKQIENMVEAVENAPENFEGASRYTAAFFNDEANRADTPSDSTYMQTESGLKYVVTQEGTGRQPSATDNVTVHYTGTLTNGKVFDSSVSRGEPTSFPLNRVIPGWTEGLQLMKEGGTTIFYIPSELAYGEQGAPGAIPPNAPLIFWVQLIQVQ